MKILLANEGCIMGGVETWMVSLSRMLRERGHECELFFFNHGPMEENLPEDLTAHFGDLADLMKLVRSKGFDIVHANSTDWHVGLAAVRMLGPKLVLTSHGRNVPTWNPLNADALVSCSRWEAEEQRAETGVEVQTVLNGIDTARFKAAEVTEVKGPPIVAWIGRGINVEQKRIDKLAEVAPLLHAAGMRLYLVEPYGPEEVAKVAPEAVDALQPIADFWGAVPVEKMAELYLEVAASGGCVLSTSSFEGLPLTLLEAQAAGCPAIGPDVRGVNECISPEHGGVLYPFEMKAEEVAALIIETLSDEEGMRRRRAESERFARERFSLERMAGDYLKIYEQALGKPRKSFSTERSLFGVWPRLGWKGYLEYCWTGGHSQYLASEKLAAQGEWRLAELAARSALSTCPTLFTRPRRVFHLLKTELRSKAGQNRLR
ncbi:MAG TPA: glycosyltransferase family 4 protein [Pyrinomonadaceae bacterium]|nr:glycosyltransferase family 4 protein [Pyrinomonadaceae bacterium]